MSGYSGTPLAKKLGIKAAHRVGLVDNKVCAIDETFSGLRFVVRVENREEWPPA